MRWINFTLKCYIRIVINQKVIHFSVITWRQKKLLINCKTIKINLMKINFFPINLTSFCLTLNVGQKKNFFRTYSYSASKWTVFLCLFGDKIYSKVLWVKSCFFHSSINYFTNAIYWKFQSYYLLKISKMLQKINNNDNSLHNFSINKEFFIFQ